MRLLRPEQQRAINQYLVLLVYKLGYRYSVDASTVRVISGVDEGAFLWLAVNYLLGRFETSRGFMLRDSSLLQTREHFTPFSIEVC